VRISVGVPPPQHFLELSAGLPNAEVLRQSCWLTVNGELVEVAPGRIKLDQLDGEEASWMPEDAEFAREKVKLARDRGRAAD
jgi:hypothetical protein